MRMVKKKSNPKVNVAIRAMFLIAIIIILFKFGINAEVNGSIEFTLKYFG
ncbi:hypothetical protein [Clostridium beijerinckii]|nr:hypothetical protein [Clostridium beijerinckii]